MSFFYVVIPTVFTFLIFIFLKFSYNITALKCSYIKVLEMMKESSEVENIISESFFQIKLLLSIIFKIILGLFPFVIYYLILGNFNRNWITEFFDLKSNLTIFVTIVILSSIKKYGTK
jgi:hypothetical protein